jgi:hypothetical protein
MVVFRKSFIIVLLLTLLSGLAGAYFMSPGGLIWASSLFSPTLQYRALLALLLSGALYCSFYAIFFGRWPWQKKAGQVQASEEKITYSRQEVDVLQKQISIVEQTLLGKLDIAGLVRQAIPSPTVLLQSELDNSPS